ncbi:hypothetical protein ACIG3E_32690 [Streptomyces sp. NPDC053474]|uniref:hypothetical protein n=1 Tax=Streptomyces sp. NPDC053474 TaxID=3365704 RepID=UPI0037CDC8D8
MTPAKLARLLDEQDGHVHLDLDGVFFAVDTATRRICWSDPMGPSLMFLPGVRVEIGGPAVYNHIDLYYDQPWAPRAYTPRPVQNLGKGDLVTWEGCLRTVLDTAPAPRGKVNVFVNDPTFTGPYPRAPHDLVPVHPPA